MTFDFLLLKNSSVSISFISQNFFKHLISTHKSTFADRLCVHMKKSILYYNCFKAFSRAGII